MITKVRTITIQLTENETEIDVSVRTSDDATPSDYLMAAARLLIAVGGSAEVAAIAQDVLRLATMGEVELVMPS